jgi:DNA-binding transcriptional LysR family regulator
MDLSKINLNLLVALQALLKEKHVTKAGKRLHITQSAMSNILKQLRETFHDELFIRGHASSMIPTPRALELSSKIDEVLKNINCILTKKDVFNCKEEKHTFTIGLSDYSEFVFLPEITRLITNCAPNVRIVVKHVNYLKDESIFENDEVDVVIGFHLHVPERLISQDILSDIPVIVGCKDNAALKNPLTIEEYVKAKQILVLYLERREDMHSEQIIQEMGLEREVMVTVPDSLAAIHAIPGTPLVMNVLKRLVIPLKKYLPIVIQPSPFKYPQFYSRMIWHPKNKNYPPHIWLREQMKRIADKIEKEQLLTC